MSDVELIRQRDEYRAQRDALRAALSALRAERDEALTLLREVREDAKYFRMPTDRIDAFLAKHKEQR